MRSSAGFTLLELLVALTVLGVLMVLMFGGLRFGARVWESGDASLRGLSEMQTAAGFIRREISQATPVSAPREDGDTGAAAPLFRGTPDALRLVGPPPSQLLPGGLYETVIGIEDGVGAAGNSGRRLSVWWRPLPRGVGNAAAGQPPATPIDADPRTRQVVLLDGVADLRLSYFGQGEDVNELPQWHDRWDTMLSPPSLVSVQIAFMPGDRRSWPQLVVAPVATLSD